VNGSLDKKGKTENYLKMRVAGGRVAGGGCGLRRGLGNKRASQLDDGWRAGNDLSDGWGWLVSLC
jgi:hypothetical protein